MLQLHTYFRSSASFRVRIALELKGLAYEAIPVHLVRGGGEQHQSAFRTLNPAGLVPVLQDGDATLTQSMAILEYLEEQQTSPTLLPGDAVQRATIRGLAQQIACDIHPLNNLRVLQYLTATLGVSDTAKQAWIQHWILSGFDSLEKIIARHAGSCCIGDQPTLADVTLIPQVFNALRFNVPMERYPTILRIYKHCMSLPAFQKAAPSAQIDAE